ncbi:alpha-amylase family glycosyl hydrolase [Bellilinea caldifistulae]|uniref:alpha-amylase family glycosyl hydrolase n=1 Tax=Bellilinea caldifistulae TaxID=360411 RepID=UPI00146FFA41|nr:alpha-amylase family glycosyl hydrolase [Bellilinea caldifistulae]
MNKPVFLLIILTLVSACTAPQSSPNGNAVQVNEPVLTLTPTDVDEWGQPLNAQTVNEPVITLTPTDVVQENGEWWKTAVFYQVFVRGFYDSNGDGIGDFRGLIQKLDYLNDGNPETATDLGVTALWLMPIHPSPSYHGYDVTDYYNVNPDYGTMDDFRELIEAAHQRGIKVIIDLVINHTSTQHTWFKQALESESPFYDYYIWQDENPGYSGPQGQVVWHRASNGKYYYALFWDQMPDLNLKNPAVKEEIYQIVRFWLEDVGVDGFRLDAAKHLIEEETQQENTALTHEWLANFYAYYKSLKPQAITVGEVWANSFEAVRYVRNSEMDMVFNFDLARSILSNINDRDAISLSNTLTFETRLFPTGSMGVFLTNHDQDRVMTVLMKDIDKARLAAAVYLTSPGVPFIYYGEEIGLTGQGDHRNIRTPMHWSSERMAGFTSTTPWIFPKMDYPEKNVQKQLEDPESLLRFYINLLRIRNQSDALQTGQFIPLSSSSPSILSYARVSQNDQILILLNLGDQPQNGVTLRSPEGLKPGRYRLQPLAGRLIDAIVSVEQNGSLDDFEFPETIAAGDVLIYQFIQIPES